MSTQHGDHERTTDETVVVLRAPEPGPVNDPLADAVDDAIGGELLADAPEAQPDRRIDASDFPSLYIRHRFAMQCHARRFLHDAHDIEDVVQETFLKLFLAIPEIETERQALAFERRVMTNLCIDRYRTAKRRPSVIALDNSDYDRAVPATERIDPVIQAEDAAVVREALAMLSPLHRAALVKREIEEKPLPVIAAELGIPVASVKHLLFRARRALRALLVGTSVEPGVDLTAHEVVDLANRRLGRATLSAANGLILIVVAALTVVGTLRSGHAALVNDSIGRVMTEQSATGGTTVVPRHHPNGNPNGAAADGHHQTAGHTTQSVVAGPTASTQPSPHHSVATHPTKPPTTPPTGSPSPTGSPTPTGSTPPASGDPAYRLDGSLSAVGSPQISNQLTQTGSQNSMALSRFAAPITDGGSFTLDQTLVVAPDQPPVLQLQEQVTNGAGENVHMSTSSTTPSLTASATTHQVTIAGQAVGADGSSVNVLLVYNRSMTKVISETVSVGGLGARSSQPAPSTTPSAGAAPADESAQINSSANDDRTATGALMKDMSGGSGSLSRTPPW